MKSNIFLIFMVFSFYPLFAQKKQITDSACISWPFVNGGLISPDGKFATYNISNFPKGKTTTVITATDKNWNRSFNILNDIKFSENSRFFIAQSEDTLIKLNLQTKTVVDVASCNNIRILSKGSLEWLAYQLKDSLNTLKIEQLYTGRVVQITGVESYIFSEARYALILKIKQNSKSQNRLCLLDLRTGKTDYFFKGNGIGDVIFDQQGNQVAFTILEHGIKHIRCYDIKSKILKKLSVDLAKAKPDSVEFSTAAMWRFTSDGKRLLFTLEPIQTKMDSVYDKVTIWNYQDAYLPQQYKGIKTMLERGKNLSAVEISSGKTVRLLSGNQKVSSDFIDLDILFVVSTNGIRGDVPWNMNISITSFFCFPKTGVLDTLPAEVTFQGIIRPAISPDKRFLIYYDFKTNNYVSYDLHKKNIEIISRDIHEDLSEYSVLDRGHGEGGIGVAGWITDLKRVVIQGRYNLWSVDPTNTDRPINLTDMGQKNRDLLFSLPAREYKFKSKDYVLVSSYNFVTKMVEIYNWNFGQNRHKKLFQTVNYLSEPYGAVLEPFRKAKKANKYLFISNEVNKSPNYVISHNWETFDTISNIHPEANYNWMKSEIIKYKDMDGQECEAVLYKPEDFDRQKRYPVILDYYTIQTTKYNKYVSPEPDGAGMNIPLLVSKGYLVVKPNIYPKTGNPGEAALSSVNAVADHLSKFNWIDSTKIAITGYSFGGYETNYIVTHSKRFAAAVSGAGITNMIDGVAGRWRGTSPSFGYYIDGPYRMKKELNEYPEGYGRNSPMMSTGKVGTPLLLIHNELDPSVPVEQSQQFFVQLRRQGKRVWLLQYDDERHFLMNQENSLDLQRRVTEFFDHYLKGTPMPLWMKKHN